MNPGKFIYYNILSIIILNSNEFVINSLTKRIKYIYFDKKITWRKSTITNLQTLSRALYPIVLIFTFIIIFMPGRVDNNGKIKFSYFILYNKIYNCIHFISTNHSQLQLKHTYRIHPRGLQFVEHMNNCFLLDCLDNQIVIHFCIWNTIEIL